MRFHFVVAVRNADPWIERCVQSILAQKNQPFTVNVVDDASTDNTATLAESLLLNWGSSSDAWSMGRNQSPRGALANQCWAIAGAKCEPDDVIVIVDGDDHLAHDNVLNVLAAHYEDQELEVTYGNYSPDPPSTTCPSVRALPVDVAGDRSIRDFTRRNGIWFNHLRTFRFRCFDQIDQAVNFRWRDGAWFQTCADTAVMIPLLELAGAHYQFIPEVLLRYNSENPTSDWRRDSPEIERTHHHILAELSPVVPQ